MATRRTLNSLRRGLLPTVACTLLGCAVGGTCAASDGSVQARQADSYEVGEHEILALRERARAELGVRFDIRKFHNAVIDHGSLPLPVLDQVIAAWIDAQRPGSAG